MLLFCFLRQKEEQKNTHILCAHTEKGYFKFSSALLMRVKDSYIATTSTCQKENCKSRVPVIYANTTNTQLFKTALNFRLQTPTRSRVIVTNTRFSF